MSRMPLRTKIFTTLLDALAGDGVAGMDLAQIRRNRASVPPRRVPATWVTGPVLAGVDISEQRCTVRDGHQVTLRVYRPDGPADQATPVILYFHGGGWVLGSTRGYDPLCTFLAKEAGAVVVSVDYRMAPEHRAPTAANDCVDATRWVGGHPESLGLAPSSIASLAVAGDSAGANLAAVVCQVVRDQGGPKIDHQALLYPGTDATMSAPSVAEHAQGPVLTRRNIQAFLAHYLGPDGLDPKDPLVSPLWADSLADLPPALVQTADLDPLRDEGRWYADKLADAGVSVRHTNYVGAPHGFASFPGATTCGPQARAELVSELRAHLRPVGSRPA